jgi:ankyrin repeat protein
MLNVRKNAEGKTIAAPSRRGCLKLIAALAMASFAPGITFAGAYEDFIHAVKMDDESQVKSLLARGVDPNMIEPERGDSALTLALREGSMKVFKALLDARNINIELKSRNGDNPLMVAAYKENKPAVEALLAKGAEVNHPGWTALHYGAAVGNNDIVRILLEKSAYIDAESPNKTTPIMMAARGGHINTVKLLLDQGADATLKNERGMNAIDFAKNHNHKDIAEGLTYRLKKSGKL